MKTKKNIRRFTEPLVYFVLVAAFGFITTVVNHSGKEEQIREAEFVTLTMESELEALLAQEETGVSL
ncbi:hypothetical protein ACFLTA_04050 [Bacteroidota bacterium]